MARFVVPPGWPKLPEGWNPPIGWQPNPKWGPPPADWSFWQDDEGLSTEEVSGAPFPEVKEATIKSFREKPHNEKALASAKKFFAQAQKLQAKNEELFKQAASRTREVLQDERTKAAFKNFVEDERTKNILKKGAMIGLAAAGAALIERNAGGAAAAAVAEHKRQSVIPNIQPQRSNNNLSSSTNNAPGPEVAASLLAELRRTRTDGPSSTPLAAPPTRTSSPPSPPNAARLSNMMAQAHMDNMAVIRNLHA